MRDLKVEKDKLSNLLIELVEDLAEKMVISKIVINTHIEGAITNVLANNQYEVNLSNGETYTLPRREGLTLVVGDIVLVEQVNGDINKRFIDCKRPY